MLRSLKEIGESPLPESEVEAIRFAEKVTVAHREVTRHDIEHLQKYWSAEQIVELMCVIGLFNYLNRFSVAFGLTPTKPGEGGPEDREGARQSE